MNDEIIPVGKKWMRLGPTEYTSKKGTKVRQYGLEEVVAVPDGDGIGYQRAFNGKHLLLETEKDFDKLVDRLVEARARNQKPNGTLVKKGAVLDVATR